MERNTTGRAERPGFGIGYPCVHYRKVEGVTETWEIDDECNKKR